MKTNTILRIIEKCLNKDEESAIAYALKLYEQIEKDEFDFPIDEFEKCCRSYFHPEQGNWTVMDEVKTEIKSNKTENDMDFALEDGIYVLTGIAETEKDKGWGEKVNAVILELNGKRYAMEEDPQDGYRSTGDFYELPENDELMSCPLVKIPSEEVLLKTSYVTKEWGDNSFFYEFFNPNSGNLICKVGTENYDDWYPYAVFVWCPENLECNKDR